MERGGGAIEGQDLRSVLQNTFYFNKRETKIEWIYFCETSVFSVYIPLLLMLQESAIIK